MKVLQIGALAIAVLSFQSSASSEIFLQENCKCLTQDELPPSELLLPASPLFGVRNISDYGVGCKSHDRSSAKCVGNRDKGSWCEKPWCFVDPKECALSNSRSIYFRPSRFFSYAACGHIDTFTRDPVRLSGQVLKGVLHDNHRGYQGTICDTPDKGPCHGPVADLAKYLVQEAGLNVTIDYTYTVPDSVAQIANAYGPFLDEKENMRHGRCVYAAGMGTVDICIGAFTKNRHRSAVSPFVEMGVTSEYLIVMDKKAPKTTREMIESIFAPFHWSLWALNFGILIALSLLFVVQESPVPCRTLFKKSPFSTVTKASYNAMFRFASQETMIPSDGDDGRTWGGRFTLLAIGIQILLTGASYTANLTNFLVRTGLETTIVDMEDAIAKRVKICVLRNKIEILYNTYSEEIIRPLLAIDPDSESNPDRLPGFPEREQLLSAMDKGICRAAIGDDENMAELHGKGEHCDKHKVGDSVIVLPWGIPVSERFQAPLNTAISTLMQNGEWRKLTEKHVPEDICEIQEIDIDTEPLYPKNLLGAYVLSGVLAGIGLLISLINNSTNFGRQHTGAGNDKFASEAGGNVCVAEIANIVAMLSEKIERLEIETAVDINQQQQLDRNGNNKRRQGGIETYRIRDSASEDLNSDSGFVSCLGD